MKQLRYRLLIMLAALVLLPTGVGAAEAQKDLKIQDVFTRYGKKRNVTMVELSNEMLETYGMTRYKSITIKDDPEALRFTRQCLEADQRGARKIKEVTDDGGVVSAYYPVSYTHLTHAFLPSDCWLQMLNRCRPIRSSGWKTNVS